MLEEETCLPTSHPVLLVSIKLPLINSTCLRFQHFPRCYAIWRRELEPGISIAPKSLECFRVDRPAMQVVVRL